MRIQAYLLPAIACAVAFTGCAERETPLQTAVDELQRLSAYTETSLAYPEYSNRLLAAKGTIAVALQHSRDEGAKARIEHALNYYVEAQNVWKQKRKDDDARAGEVENLWAKAREATDVASEFALGDSKKRDRIREHELALFNEALRAEEEAKRLADQAQKARKAQQAEAEAKRHAAEQKMLAEEAERERIRRYAPEGTVYSIKRITFNTPDGIASVPPGTELRTVRKNYDGTVRVRIGDLETDVPAASVTNDRDLAAAVRATLPVNGVIRQTARRSASSQGAASSATAR